MALFFSDFQRPNVGLEGRWKVVWVCLSSSHWPWRRCFKEDCKRGQKDGRTRWGQGAEKSKNLSPREAQRFCAVCSIDNKINKQHCAAAAWLEGIRFIEYEYLVVVDYIIIGWCGPATQCFQPSLTFLFSSFLGAWHDYRRGSKSPEKWSVSHHNIMLNSLWPKVGAIPKIQRPAEKSSRKLV